MTTQKDKESDKSMFRHVAIFLAIGWLLAQCLLVAIKMWVITGDELTWTTVVFGPTVVFLMVCLLLATSVAIYPDPKAWKTDVLKK